MTLYMKAMHNPEINRYPTGSMGELCSKFQLDIYRFFEVSLGNECLQMDRQADRQMDSAITY